MTEWYLDIETEGPDPRRDKILTIQYQSMSGGVLTGSLQVLAEWEWGEKQVVRSILEKGVLEPTGDFVPVGTRVMDDLAFLMERADRLGLKKFTMEETRRYWSAKPTVDLAPILGMVQDPNSSGLSVSGARRREVGSIVSKLYLEGRFPEIIDLVTRERDEIIALLREARDTLGHVARMKPASPPPTS